MAQPTISSSGAIGKLPCELLTQALSYLSQESITEARLVCRGFRDCAWQAFGGVISDETIFDLRSLESMQNLDDISREQRLAPHIVFLRVATGFLPQNWPGPQLPNDATLDDLSSEEDIEPVDPKHYLPTELYDDLSASRELLMNDWLEDVWKLSPCSDHSMSELEHESSQGCKRLMIGSLSKCLAKFNLHGALYLEDYIPAACQEVYGTIGELLSDRQVPMIGHISPRRSALDIIGLDVLLRSLVKAEVRLQSLAVPVVVMYCHTFASYTSRRIWHKLLTNVETFTTWNMDALDYSHHLSEGNQVILSSLTAPKLTTLNWGDWVYSHKANPSFMKYSVPKVAPPITKLCLTKGGNLPMGSGVKDIANTFKSYLEKIGTTLTELSFRMRYHLDWHAMVTFLAESKAVNLRKLEITACAPDINALLAGTKTPSKALVYSAADEVVLEHEDFRVWLEQRWAKALVDELRKNMEVADVD